MNLSPARRSNTAIAIPRHKYTRRLRLQYNPIHSVFILR